MKKHSPPIAYLQEQSIRNLIKLLAENYFKATPKTKLPQQVFKVIQKIIDDEGQKTIDSAYLKRHRIEIKTLVVSARDYQTKNLLNSIGTAPESWLYNSNHRTTEKIKTTKNLFNFLAKDRGVSLLKIEREFIKYLSNTHIEKQELNAAADVEDQHHPNYMAGYILQMLGYPSYQTQNRLFARKERTGIEEWQLTFGYLFKNVFPLPPAVFVEVWRLIEPHLTEIRFSVDDRTFETLTKKKP